jgi:hypothetical protein
MGIFDKKDDMGNRGSIFGRGPKRMHRGRNYDNVQNQKLTDEQQGALDSFHQTGSTDHHDYDMGEYEKSGPNKYGHPEKPAGKMKMPHASQMRMNDMVAKVYGSPMPPSQLRSKSNAETKQDFTTYGMPNFLYTEQGEKINTANVDEGNLSAIQRVHKHGESVVVQDDTERFKKGTRLFLENPTGASKYKMPPAQNNGKAKAVANTPKKPARKQRPK